MIPIFWIFGSGAFATAADRFFPVFGSRHDDDSAEDDPEGAGRFGRFGPRPEEVDVLPNIGFVSCAMDDVEIFLLELILVGTNTQNRLVFRFFVDNIKITILRRFRFTTRTCTARFCQKKTIFQIWSEIFFCELNSKFVSSLLMT